MWGHDRGWFSAEQQADARALRLEERRRGLSPPGPGDRRQLPGHDRRLPVVGRSQGANRGGAIAGRAPRLDEAVPWEKIVWPRSATASSPSSSPSWCWSSNCRPGPTWTALSSVAPSFASYVISFVYLGIYWNNHHHLLHTVARVDGLILWANLHLLFWLSLIPAATAWMGQNLVGAGADGGVWRRAVDAGHRLFSAAAGDRAPAGRGLRPRQGLGPRLQGQDIAGLLHRGDRAGVRQSLAVDGALCAGRGDVACARPADRNALREM